MKKSSPVKNTLIFILLLLILASVIWYLHDLKGVRRAVKGIGDPVQTETEGGTTMSVGSWEVNVTYKYAYDIEALVVHAKDYSGFRLGDRLAPKDAALAWGKVAEYNEKIDFHWEQSGRWYGWQYDSVAALEPVGGIEGVSQHSANCHLIPKDSSVRRKISRIKMGDHIHIKGYLVDINASKPNGATFWWHSSVTRDDTGDGACELIYVTDIEWVE